MEYFYYVQISNIQSNFGLLIKKAAAHHTLHTSLEISFSPCPNDTYIFYALVHGKIQSPLSYSSFLADVEVLNQRVLQGLPAVSKISFGVLPQISKHYTLLNCGGALGFQNGPLLIAAKPIETNNSNLKIGIPGIHTTANKLLAHFYPHLQNKKELLFSDIENALLNGDIDLGLIIHESRFTYAQRGLYKLADLGEMWYHTYQLPLPLGGIVLRNDILHLKAQIENDIRNSIAYAYKHTEEAMPYIRQHAQEMSDAIMQQHIELYVNRFSSNISDEGKRAVKLLGGL